MSGQVKAGKTQVEHIIFAPPRALDAKHGGQHDEDLEVGHQHVARGDTAMRDEAPLVHVCRFYRAGESSRISSARISFIGSCDVPERGNAGG